MTGISSDGDNGFNLDYRVYGESATVHLNKDNFSTTNPRYDKDVDAVTGYSYWLYSFTDAFANGPSNAGGDEADYLDVNGFIIYDRDTDTSVRGAMVYGARTDPANLPTEEVFYSGRMRADSYDVDDPITATSRTRIRSDATLVFDFGNGTLAGLLDNFRIREPGESAYGPLPDQTITLGDGKIIGGQFTAKLTGSGLILDGATGDALGAFYGPDGEEVGAVINGAVPNENVVFYGYIFGDKQ